MLRKMEVALANALEVIEGTYAHDYRGRRINGEPEADDRETVEALLELEEPFRDALEQLRSPARGGIFPCVVISYRVRCCGAGCRLEVEALGGHRATNIEQATKLTLAANDQGLPVTGWTLDDKGQWRCAACSKKLVAKLVKRR